MNKKSTGMNKNLLRRIFRGLSYTSALFIFQACYGTPQDFGLDVLVEGQVKSNVSGLPIKGIKVTIPDKMQYATTDENGRFSFYTEMLEGLKIQFQDVDSTKSGQYINKDTVLTSRSEKVYFDILMEEKK